MQRIFSKKGTTLVAGTVSAALLIASSTTAIGCADANVANSDPSAYEASAASTSSITRVTTAEVEELIADPTINLIILDVRKTADYENGHIPDAISFPLTDITEESAAAVIPTKESPIAVYCRSGKKTKKAEKVLLELGYSQIYEIGGIATNWDGEIVK